MFDPSASMTIAIEAKKSNWVVNLPETIVINPKAPSRKNITSTIFFIIVESIFSTPFFSLRELY